MSPLRRNALTSRHRLLCPSGSSSGAASAAVTGSASGAVGAGPARRAATSATRGSSAARAVGSSTGAKVAAPTDTDRGPTSTVRLRVMCWVNIPLLRSVNCTPATTSTAASSTAVRVAGGLAAPV